MPVNIEYDGGSRLIATCEDSAQARVLTEYLSIEHPQKAIIKKRRKKKKDDWDGRIKFYRNVGDSILSIPTGMLHRLVAGMKREGVPYNNFSMPTMSIPPRDDLLNNITLDADQKDCLLAMLTNPKCSIQLATGSGKTEIIFAAIASVLDVMPESRILVVSSKRVLVNDILKRKDRSLPQYAKLFGQLGDSSCELNQIVVSTSQSASDNRALTNYDEIRQWKSGVDVLILDECHHTKSNSWREIIVTTKPDILWGLSGKVIYVMDDLPNLELESIFGPPTYVGGSVTRRVPTNVCYHRHKAWDDCFGDLNLVMQIVDMIPVVFRHQGKMHEGFYRGVDEDGNVPDFMLEVDAKTGKATIHKELYGIYWDVTHRVEPQPDPVDVIYSTAHDICMMEFDKMNIFFVRLAAEVAGEGFIITVRRRRHMKHLAKLFAAYAPGVRVGFVNGETKGADQLKAFEDVEKGVLDGVVCLHSIVSEGVNIPRATHFIKLDGYHGEQVLEQQKGRVERASGDKECGYIHIPWTRYHPAFENSLARMMTYFTIREIPQLWADHDDEDDDP